MKKILFVLSLGLALNGAGAFADDKDCKDHSKFGEISYDELNTKLADRSVTVIDVNSKDSFKKAHIPSAIHFGTEQKTLAKKLPKNKDMLVVAYCGGPTCTAWQKAAEAACEMGYTNIKHYKPGITGWVKKS